MSILFKKLKRNPMKNIKTFFNNIKGWIQGSWQMYISQKDVIYSFYGFGHFGLAKKYADRRNLRNGYRHYVLPAGRTSEQIVVFNSHELKALKRAGLVNKRVTIEILLNESYYITPRKK